MRSSVAAIGVTIGLILANTSAVDAANGDARQLRPLHIDHVLLISVDGLHALDVRRYVETHKNSALAELASHGIIYSNASTPAHSDSFPGLLALVTGGSPVSHGVFYDASYDRTLYAPTNTTWGFRRARAAAGCRAGKSGSSSPRPSG